MTKSIDLAKLGKPKLELLIGRTLDENEFKSMLKVCEKYPVKVSEHILSLMKKYPEIAKQYLPDYSELEGVMETEKPWKGRIETGIPGTERMYGSEMIVIASANCASNCRACIRRNYLNNSKEEIKLQDLGKLIEYVDKERIKEVLITGGDPLMKPEYTLKIVGSLLKTEVKHIRIGTALLRADPERITDRFILELLLKVQSYAKEPNFIEIAPHFDHPAEFSRETIRKIRALDKVGFKLYVQTILLKGINDNKKTFRELAERIRENNMEWYYLYHCVPLNGNLHLRTSVKKGFELMDSLEDHEEVTGRYPPKRYAVPLPIGKVSLDPSRIIEQEGKYIWIETRYMTDSLKGNPLPNFCRVGKKGFLEVKYLDGID